MYQTVRPVVVVIGLLHISFGSLEWLSSDVEGTLPSYQNQACCMHYAFGLDCRSNLFDFFLLQPPPAPWLNQRPPLDVNVGKYNRDVNEFISLSYVFIYHCLLVAYVEGRGEEVDRGAASHQPMTQVINICSFNTKIH